MPELPSGTVTFLFTDLEGSTALWEHQSEAMRLALARHDALVRAAIAEHGGHVVKTMGDAFHAAFRDAPAALAAAIDAQRRLGAEAWGETGALRVRMALHTGAAEERDGDYYGPPLNRAARLMSAETRPTSSWPMPAVGSSSSIISGSRASVVAISSARLRP